MPILALQAITKRYPGVLALGDVDFTLERGEVRALLGKNGAGKSTLVKVLSGAVKPDEGRIYIDGEVARIEGPRDAFELGICTVYQEMSLVPGLTVAENILLGRWPRKRLFGVTVIDKERIYEVAQRSLDQLEIDLDLAQPVSRLSVAEQQLVEIAKALSFDPRVLILDEPTSALASEEVETLHTVVRRLAGQGRAIIYVTHRLQEIPRVADSVTVLRDGRDMGTISVEEATPERIAHMMIGTDWESGLERRSAPEAGEARLSVRHLYRQGLLYDITFDVHAGEVVGIAGLLGSGRTELMRSIFGLDPMDEGEVWVNGERIENPGPIVMKEHGVGMLPEDRKQQGLVLPFSVKQNLTLASMDRYNVNGILQPEVAEAMAEEMVGELQIKTPSLEVKTRTLSGGNQQKVVVGNWLNTQPQVLIMDEPSRGIDIQAKEQIFNLVRELAGRGMAVLFVSSEIEEVLEVADRILIMNQGHLTGEVTPEEISLERLLALVMEERVHA
jgi:ribose transport system ATP-binding protein